MTSTKATAGNRTRPPPSLLPSLQGIHQPLSGPLSSPPPSIYLLFISATSIFPFTEDLTLTRPARFPDWIRRQFLIPTSCTELGCLDRRKNGKKDEKTGREGGHQTFLNRRNFERIRRRNRWKSGIATGKKTILLVGTTDFHSSIRQPPPLLLSDTARIFRGPLLSRGRFHREYL